MNALINAALLILLAEFLLSYRTAMREWALEHRDAMTDDCAAMLVDPQLSFTARRAALMLFHLSMRQSLIFELIGLSWRKRSERQAGIGNMPELTEYDSTALREYVRKHLFKVNFAACPHWYILFGTIAVVASIALLIIRTASAKLYSVIAQWIREKFVRTESLFMDDLARHTRA